MWNKIRKILGMLTDILTSGRKAGLWSENQGPKPISSEKPHDPSFPNLKQ
jgi:hypothetical protein